MKARCSKDTFANLITHGTLNSTNIAARQRLAEPKSKRCFIKYVKCVTRLYQTRRKNI